MKVQRISILGFVGQIGSEHLCIFVVVENKESQTIYKTKRCDYMPGKMYSDKFEFHIIFYHTNY